MKRHSYFNDCKRRLLFFSLLGVLSLLGACTRDDAPSHHSSSSPDKLPMEKTVVELRGAGEEAKSTRFLGRGFNLLEHRLNDESGFSLRKILDFNRIDSNEPWSPWGEAIPNDLDGVEVLTERVYSDGVDGVVEDVTDKYSQETINLNLGGKFQEFVFGFKYAKVLQREEKVHSFRHYSYDIEEKAFLDVNRIADFQYYLTPRFVRHLSSMSGDELIDNYGTHLVTQYDLGAFSDFVLMARSENFTVEEGLELTGSALSDSVKLSASLSNKLKNSLSSLSITYRQGGSDYRPDIISAYTLFGGSTPKFISVSEWNEKRRPYDRTFMSLPSQKQGMIPIPDLIKPLPLKVKYISAILHRANPNTNIVYVLSDPKTYQPIKYKGEYLYTILNTYRSGAAPLYYGNGYTRSMSPKELMGASSNDPYWDVELCSDGRWVFFNTYTKSFLCTDLRLRTAKEDVNNLRYWVVNPIPPKPGYSSKAWGQMMIKPKND